MLNPTNGLVIPIAFLVSALATSVVSDSIRGVNLGGWLLTEPWITPSLYALTNAADEWSLCATLGKEKCSKHLRRHWNSFITRKDLEQIKSFGLNSIRVPLGYWAVDVLPEEPYVDGQYPYLLRAVQWAQELGLRVLIDLHGAPGSQNGQDNSGREGEVLFPRNESNAERSIGVLSNLTQEFGGGRYGGAVKGIELLNEPRLSDPNFPISQLKSFYANASSAIRSAEPSSDPSKTPDIIIHDAFYGPAYWSAYHPQPSTNVTTDTHSYYAFPPLASLSRSEILSRICTLAQTLRQPLSPSSPPATVVGEFSPETNVHPTTSSSFSSSFGSDDQARRTWYRLLFEAQAVAYAPPFSSSGDDELVGRGWYFWTYKTEYDIDTWSYRRGVKDGYLPSDAGNASTYAYPVGENGCVDEGGGYVAPLHAGAGRRMGGGMMRVMVGVGIAVGVGWWL